jgi:chromate transporter
VGFIGYLIAGQRCRGRSARYLPSVLIARSPAPYFKSAQRPALLAFVAGLTAAAIGAITGAVIVLAGRSVVDLTTAAIALLTVGLVWKVKKLPEPVIVAVAAIVGLAVFPGGPLHP